MNVLTVLNEPHHGAHIDTHQAFGLLKQEGKVNEYRIYPFTARFLEGSRSKEVIAEIFKSANELQPHVILWAHTPGLHVSKETIELLRLLPSQPAIGYWEGDLYEAPFKPLPSEVLELASLSDIVFCQGFGSMTDSFVGGGCRDIRFVPAPTDPWRFCRMRSSPGQIRYDVVMIGNNVTRSLFWRTMPGTKLRREVVKLFNERLGGRFAVFGEGWKGASAAGPIPFDKQLDAYHMGRIALGVNNLHGKYYFSNRLPIAMSSGVPVVYNKEHGFERIFDAQSGCLFFRDAEEAWKIVEGLLRKSQSELDAIGRAALKTASERFTITRILKYIVDSLSACRNASLERGAGSHDSNPWLSQGTVLHDSRTQLSPT